MKDDQAAAIIESLRAIGLMIEALRVEVRAASELRDMKRAPQAYDLRYQADGWAERAKVCGGL